MPYTIIIPIHNEADILTALLEGIETYANNHEVIIIDDGSTDGSYDLLSKGSFFNLIRLEHNSGKGVAIRKGLEQASHEKIIISDGDMELDPKEIGKLMILDKNKGITCVFGSRYETIKPFVSLWDFGNYLFTGLFNMVYGSKYSDVLCCAKAFYGNDLDIKYITAQGFDIDVELAATLTKKSMGITIVNLSYNRRSKNEGKKLRFSDGWSILKKIITE